MTAPAKNTAAKITHAPSAAAKYLTFTLGQESYGIPVLKVREILRLPDITPVPQMPDYISGVINLRGKVVPVFDLRVKFRLSDVTSNERTCIIVLQVTSQGGETMQVGIIADTVEEVVFIPQNDIEATPNFGANLSTEYILGMAKVRGSVKTLLDVDQIFSWSSFDLVNQSK
jgi:purine-binding chemotaxis protein CheW